MKNQRIASESEHAHAPQSRVRIRNEESELPERVRQAIGDEPVAAFGRRCGINESTLRKYFSGTLPNVENLISIADAANVSIEWLAAGRGPKQRGASVHALPTSPPVAKPTGFGDVERLSSAIAAVQEGLDAIHRQLPPDKHAQLIAAAYELLDNATSSAKVVQFIKLAA